MPGRDRRWARRAQCPRAQQAPRSSRALNGRGNCREGSPGIHAGEDVPEALNLLLKSLIHRQRPHLWAGLWSLTDYSFPSGHSMAAMAIYGLLAYLLSLHYPRQAWLIKLGAAGLILAIGASRMLLGVHWPMDVLGGYAAGACVLCACVYWYEGRTGRTDLLKPRANER